MAEVDVLVGAAMLTTGGNPYNYLKDVASVKSSVLGKLWLGQDMEVNGPAESECREAFDESGATYCTFSASGEWLARVLPKTMIVKKVVLTAPVTGFGTNWEIYSLDEGEDQSQLSSYTKITDGATEGTLDNESRTITLTNPVETRAILFKALEDGDLTALEVYQDTIEAQLIATDGDSYCPLFYVDNGDGTTTIQFDAGDLHVSDKIQLVVDAAAAGLQLSHSTDDQTWNDETPSDATDTVDNKTASVENKVIIWQEAVEGLGYCLILPRKNLDATTFDFLHGNLWSSAFGTEKSGCDDLTMKVCAVRDLGDRFIRLGSPVSVVTTNNSMATSTASFSSTLQKLVQKVDYVAIEVDAVTNGGSAILKLSGDSFSQANLIAYGTWDLTNDDEKAIGGGLTRGTGLAEWHAIHTFQRVEFDLPADTNVRYVRFQLPDPAAQNHVAAIRLLNDAGGMDFWTAQSGGSEITGSKTYPYQPGETDDADLTVQTLWLENDTGETRTDCLAIPSPDPTFAAAPYQEVSFDQQTWVKHCQNNDIDNKQCTASNANYAKVADPTKKVAGCGKGCTTQNGGASATGGWTAPTPASYGSTVASGVRIALRVRGKFPTGTSQYKGRARASWASAV